MLRHDIAACLKEKSACRERRSARSAAATASARRCSDRSAACIRSAPRSIGGSFFRPSATAIKLPAYPFQADTHWRESETTRRMRVGRPVHPLLGDRLEIPQPSWSGDLDTAGLSYLPDHRIGDSIVFPGAGYVEMGLAAAREIFGPVPCVLEDIEFQKMLARSIRA